MDKFHSYQQQSKSHSQYQEFDIEDGDTQMLEIGQETSDGNVVQPSLCDYINLAMSGSFDDKLVRFIKYVSLVRAYLIPPDLVMCIMGIYFAAYPPDYLKMPMNQMAFFILNAVFKFVSLIIFYFAKKYIENIKHSNNIKNTFSLETVNNIKLDTNILQICAMITYLNMLWDIFVFVCTKCYGDNCNSVTMTNSPKSVIFTRTLRKILEVHILHAAVISNYLHIVVVPFFIYFWNNARNKSKCFDSFCKLVDKVVKFF